MKLSKTLKKFSAILMVFAMVFGVMGAFGGNITAKASSNPVQMYSMDHYFSKYGISQYNVYIQVDASSAANKAVYVHHTSDSDWVDTAATYFTSLDSNTEIWKANISGTNTGEYAIKYVGDGVTYWDNNDGNNYTLNNVLGTANVKAIRRMYSLSGYCIRAVVKNLSPTKTVTVRYTEDNWATYKDANLSYVSSTTGTNDELWTVTLDIDEDNSSSVQYCIRYDVNGQTYWDNNFGANYDSNFYRAY